MKVLGGVEARRWHRRWCSVSSCSPARNPVHQHEWAYGPQALGDIPNCAATTNTGPPCRHPGQLPRFRRLRCAVRQLASPDPATTRPPAPAAIHVGLGPARRSGRLVRFPAAVGSDRCPPWATINSNRRSNPRRPWV